VERKSPAALQGLVLSSVDGHCKCQPHKKLAALELEWLTKAVLGGRQGYAWNKNSLAHMATSQPLPSLSTNGEDSVILFQDFLTRVATDHRLVISAAETSIVYASSINATRLQITNTWWALALASALYACTPAAHNLCNAKVAALSSCATSSPDIALDAIQNPPCGGLKGYCVYQH